MANITITIPDASLTRIINGMATSYGYQTMIADPNDPTGETLIPNPQTKAQFAKQALIKVIKQAVIQAEGTVAASNAMTSTTTDVNSINIT